MRGCVVWLVVGLCVAAEPIIPERDTLGTIVVDWMPKRYDIEVERDGSGSARTHGRWEFSVDQRIPLVTVNDLDAGLTGGFYASLDTGLAVDGDLSRFRLGWTIGGVGIVTLSKSVRFMSLLGVGESLDVIDLPPALHAVAEHQRSVLVTNHLECLGILLIGDPSQMSLGIVGGFSASTGQSHWYSDGNLSLSSNEWGPMLGLTFARQW